MKTIQQWARCMVMALALVCAGGALSSEAAAQDFSYREGRFQLGGGLGFAASVFGDTGFHFGADMRYYITDNISIAPRMSFSFHNRFGFDWTVFSFMADALYHFDIKAASPALRKLVPFVGFGMGVDAIFGDGDDEAAFALEIPVGAEYYILPKLSLGTQMNFNFPVHRFGDNFFFQWQVATVRYIF